MKKKIITSGVHVLKPIGKQLNLKFLGGDWRRRERGSVIGEKENLLLEEGTADLSVTGTAALTPNL